MSSDKPTKKESLSFKTSLANIWGVYANHTKVNGLSITTPDTYNFIKQSYMAGVLGTLHLLNLDDDTLKVLLGEDVIEEIIDVAKNLDLEVKDKHAVKLM